MTGLPVWAGQLGVLAPWGAIAVAATGPLGHLPPFATWALNTVKWNLTSLTTRSKSPCL